MPVFALVIGLVFVAAGVFLLYQGHDSLQAWAVIAFFGACALIGFWELRPRRIKKAQPPLYPNSEIVAHTLIIKSDFIHFLVFGLGSAGLAFGGFVMMATEKAPLLGLLVLCFFGLGALILLWQVLDRRPRLVIDRDGVIDRMLGVGRIAWTDLEWAYLQSVSDNCFVCLVLRDPSTYLNKMWWIRRQWIGLNKAVGCTELNLNLSGVSVDPEEVLRVVLWHVIENNKEPSDRKPSQEYRARRSGC
jgi:hypothetical protein